MITRDALAAALDVIAIDGDGERWRLVPMALDGGLAPGMPASRLVGAVLDALTDLSPEWHAELALVAAESRNATLDEVVRVVEDIARQLAPSERAHYGIAAVLDAVKALRWLTS